MDVNTNGSNNNAADRAAAAAAAAAAATGEDVAFEQTTTKTTFKKPGFFSKVGAYLQARPIRTSVGVSVATGAGVVGAVNYRRYGQVMPSVISPNDVGDVVQAAVSMFR